MEFETERLILRDFTADDWRDVLAYQSEALYLRYNPWDERSEEDVQSFLGMFMVQQQETPRRAFQMAITLRDDPAVVIGNCGVRRDRETTHMGSIGYELAPAQWGKGYATEAARAMLNYGFETLGLHRIWADCIAENTASQHVLEKLGMRLEGRLRDNELFKGRYWDLLVFGILEHEWRSKHRS